MHLGLFWREKIPPGWKPIAPGKERRIACEVPVQFGDPETTASVSEQSVLVSGYATVHVQNLLRDLSVLGGATGILRNALAALYGGDAAIAPHGAERIDWDRRRNLCRRVWSNSRPSIPNGIPTMSRDTGLFYGITQRNGSWGVKALDFRTGRGRLLARAPAAPCSAEALADIPEPAGSVLLPTLEQFPNSCENSFYAATEVGPNKTIYTGTFLGMTIYRTVTDSQK